MEYVIREIKHNMFLNVHKSLFHWSFDNKTIFKTKWEANKIMKLLINKREFKTIINNETVENFRIEEVK